MERLERLIIDLKESLERQMAEGFAAINARFDAQSMRFDNHSARLDRHAALIQTGSRWTSRMNDWSDKVDAALEAKDRQIAEINERIKKLEQK